MKNPTAEQAEHEIAMLCAGAIKQICANHPACDDCPFCTKSGDCAVAPGARTRAPMNWDFDEDGFNFVSDDEED